MKIIALRRPINWGLFVSGLFLLALFINAATTGNAFVPRRGGSRAHIIRKSVDPKGYAIYLHFFGTFSVVFVTLAFARVVPVEDALLRFKERTDARIQKSRYATQPAPKWAYLFFAGFIGGLVWLVWYVGFCM